MAGETTQRPKPIKDFGRHLHDVIPARLERATHSLEGCCSIQLSYGTGSYPSAPVRPYQPYSLDEGQKAH